MPQADRLLAAHEIQAEKVYQDILRQRTFAQKWKQICALRDTAWKIKAAGLRSQNPTWDETQVQEAVRAIFLYAAT